jgi:cell wall-associated NlpC family hydrolase
MTHSIFVLARCRKPLMIVALAIASGMTGCATVAPQALSASDDGIVTTAALRARLQTPQAARANINKPLPRYPNTTWQDPFAAAAEGMLDLPDTDFDPRTGARDPAMILSGQWHAPDSLLAPTSELASQALGYLGIRYRMGGSSPDTGFDCSGLVSYVARQVLGFNLPRRSEEISRMGQNIEPSDLQPGDLVFYNTLRRQYSHVGIYLGEGRFVHSPSAGGVVRVDRMDMAYWKARFNGARRIAATVASAP